MTPPRFVWHAPANPAGPDTCYSPGSRRYSAQAWPDGRFSVDFTAVGNLYRGRTYSQAAARGVCEERMYRLMYTAERAGATTYTTEGTWATLPQDEEQGR